eukprot:8400149-Pyramimonas_sp.AAC.1
MKGAAREGCRTERAVHRGCMIRICLVAPVTVDGAINRNSSARRKRSKLTRRRAPRALWVWATRVMAAAMYCTVGGAARSLARTSIIMGSAMPTTSSDPTAALTRPSTSAAAACSAALPAPPIARLVPSEYTSVFTAAHSPPCDSERATRNHPSRRYSRRHPLDTLLLPASTPPLHPTQERRI